MNIALRRFLHNHGDIATEVSPKPRLCPTLISNDFFIVHSTIGSTVHSMPLNSLEHCISTTTMTNIRPDQDSNLVPPAYKPQSIRMSHRGRPQNCSKNTHLKKSQFKMDTTGRLYIFYGHKQSEMIQILV